MATDLASDEDFLAAFALAQSWRDVFRRLGRQGSPGANAFARMRAQADRLGCDVDEMVARPGPPRTWTDEDLAAAIRSCRTWREVERTVKGGPKSVRRVAQGLGLETSHLDEMNHLKEPSAAAVDLTATSDRLHIAAESLAAAWYTLHGREVYLPSAGTTLIDLLTVEGTSHIRVQVKSTNSRTSSGAWHLGCQCRLPGERAWRAYTTADVDEFFAVTGDGGMYVIPVEVLAGRRGVDLGKKYDKYKVQMF